MPGRRDARPPREAEPRREVEPLREADLTERVLACVALIPAGKVMSYSDVAEFVGTRAPRNVGRILARHGGGVPWHRVVRADGSSAEQVRAEQVRLLQREKVPFHGDRVAMTAARWDGR